MSLLACLPMSLPCDLLKCSNAHSQTPYPPLPPPQIFEKCNLFLQKGGKIFFCCYLCLNSQFQSYQIKSLNLFMCHLNCSTMNWRKNVILSSYATAVKQKHSQVSNACYFPIRLELFLDCLRLVSNNDKSIDHLLATISSPLEDFPGSMI